MSATSSTLQIMHASWDQLMYKCWRSKCFDAFSYSGIHATRVTTYDGLAASLRWFLTDRMVFQVYYNLPH